MNDTARPGDPGEDGRAIHAADLGKMYRIYARPMHRVWDLCLPGKPRHREFWAIRNVYLDVRRGSTLGIIGENGAGKSTLLKLLSGITTPTRGALRVNGRVNSLIELGAGFHPEFSGRENITLACSILGLSSEQAEARTEPIIAFSGLGDFIDRPVKTYSSGMYVRLGFAVATCADPDILLIDEALSVGDEGFRAKCINRLNEFRERGGTTIFVSHDLGAVKSMCREVLLLDRGEVIEHGPPERVASTYLKRVKARGDERLTSLGRGASEFPRWGSGEIEIHDVLFLGADERPCSVLISGTSVALRLCWRAHAAVREPVFGIGLYRSDGTYLCGTNHYWREQPVRLGEVVAGESGEVDLCLPALPLLEGLYYVTAFLYDHSKPSPTAIDHREHVLSFRVLDERHHQHGTVHVDGRWVVRRTRPGAAAPEVAESPA